MDEPKMTGSYTVPYPILSYTESETVREVYRKKPYLFGIVHIWALQRSDSIGTELRIVSRKTPEKVIINGVEYQSNQS